MMKNSSNAERVPYCSPWTTIIEITDKTIDAEDQTDMHGEWHAALSPAHLEWTTEPRDQDLWINPLRKANTGFG